MQFIKIGSIRQRSVLLLQAFLKEGEYLQHIDGKFGKGTEAAVKQYQTEHNLVVDGVVGEKSWSSLFQNYPDLLNRITSKYLSENDINEVATDLGVENALLKAVNEVESSGAGFIVEKPKILFEGHVFWKRLREHGLDPKALSRDHPDIVYSKWTKKHYLGGEREYERLETAMDIHRTAAIESASWGSFQVMGFNATRIGYPSVKKFFDLMHLHEREHLKALAKFMEVNNLVQKLKSKNWAAFARGYNGPLYAKNGYDIKLERAYGRYSS